MLPNNSRLPFSMRVAGQSDTKHNTFYSKSSDPLAILLQKRLNDAFAKVDTAVDEDLLIHTINDEIELVGQIANKRYGLNPKMLQRSYNQLIVNRGLALSKKKLKSLDIIDLQEYLFGKSHVKGTQVDFNKILQFLTEAKLNSDIESGSWLLCVPCFSEGVLQITADRYIYWKIQEIDSVNQSVTIYVKDYVNYVSDDHMVTWQPGIEGVFTASSLDLQKDCIPYKFFTDIFTEIDLNKEGWSEDEQTVFYSTVLVNAVSEPIRRYGTQLLENEKHGKTIFNSLATIFTSLIALVNIKLYNEKVRTTRTSTPQTVVAQPSEEIAVDNRHIRYVGNIKVQSVKIPRMPTEETIVKYKVPVWHARGGIRHMSDGRIIPFKDSIRRRKCLMKDNPNQAFDTPQSILKVRKDNENV